MFNPQLISPGSIMPRYQWLIRNKLDISDIQDKLKVMVTLGVPYSEEDVENAVEDLKSQAVDIEINLLEDPGFAENYKADKEAAKEAGEEFVPINQKEIVALIAYLQRLGTDIKVKEE